MPYCEPVVVKMYLTDANGKVLNIYNVDDENRKLIDEIFNKKSRKNAKNNLQKITSVL